MPLQFYLGRAGSGKTRRCLDEIAERLRRDAGPKSPPLIWLLPEQATAQAEADLLRAPGVEAFARAHVLSFRRLARLVLDETGLRAGTHWLDEQGREMLLRALVACNRDRLRVFGRSAGERGFVRRLAGLFREFTRYRVTCDDLAAELRRLEQSGQGESLLAGKMHDLLLLARAWTDRSQAAHGADPDHFLDELARRVGASALIAHAEVWADGFASFTPQETRVLGQIMRHAAEVRLTLLLNPRQGTTGADAALPDDAGRPERLFGQTEESLLRLRALAEELDVEVLEPLALPQDTDSPAPRFAGEPSLARMEAELVASDLLPGITPARTETPDPGDNAEPPVLTVVRAGTRRDEVEAAARAIRRLCRQGEPARYRDSAVIVRDLDAYEGLLREVFQRHDIPFFLDRRRPIAHHPLVALLRAALSLTAGPWEFEDVLDYLKTDFAPVSRAEADAVENYATEHGIRGRHGWTAGAWDTPPPRDAEEPEELEDFEEPPTVEFHDARSVASLDAARDRAFAPLLNLQNRLESLAQTAGPSDGALRPEHITVGARNAVKALIEFLKALGAAERVAAWAAEARAAGAIDAANEHEQAWNAAMDLLSQTALVLADDPMPLADLAESLIGGLETLTMALAPPALDGVLIGSVERSRQPPLENVFLLGFHEGGFPRPAGEDVLLSDSERQTLEDSGGISLGASATRRSLNERYLAYVALTRASRRLWVSRPGVDESERELGPSPYLPILLDCARRANVPTREVTLSAETLDGSVREAETLAQAVEGVLRSMADARPATPSWQSVEEALTAEPAATERLVRLREVATQSGRPARLEATVLALLGNLARPLSVSRLQTYAECPFHYFADYALKLRERLAFQLQAPDIGSYHHEVLNQVFRILTERHGRAAPFAKTDGRAPCPRAALDWGSVTREEAMKALDLAMENVHGEHLEEGPLGPGRMAFFRHRSRRILACALTNLIEHGRFDEFLQIGAEIEFGFGNSPLEPLPIPLSGGRSAALRGLIDRVDVAPAPVQNEAPCVRIIDYKSSPRFVDLGRVLAGLDLQLPLYLQAFLTGGPKPLQPAGAFYYSLRTRPQRIDMASSADEETPRNEGDLEKLHGFVDEEALSLFAPVAESGKMPTINVTITKSGAPHRGGGEWLPPGVVEKLCRRALREAASLVESMLEQRIEVSPVRYDSQRTACSFCPFGDVCRFEAGRIRYRTVEKVKRDEAVERLAGE